MRIPLTCLAVFSLPAASIASDVIDEITVTATRRAESLADVSSAITLVTEESIEPVITDSLRESIGVYVQQTTPGQGAVILRGLRGSAVLHLVDGMRLNNAIFRDAPTQYFSLVPSVAVERIEVVRGSPTSLYGSDAVGGVVQAVTRLPVFETSGRRGNIDVRLDTAELTRNVGGTFEFGDETFATGISASLLSTDDRRIGGGTRVGPSDFESVSLRAIVSATPSESRGWYLDAQFVEQPETPRVDELVAGFGQAESDSTVFLFKPNQRLFLHAQFRQAFESVDWVVDAAWQRIDDDRETLGRGDDALRLEENSSSLFGLTSRWSGDSGGIAWLSGAEIYFDSVDSLRRETDLVTGATSVLNARFPDGSDVLQSAVFINGHRRFFENLQLGGGLRLSRVDVDLTATELTDAAEVNASDLSADIGVIYDLNGDYQLTANAGFGFRAPNIFDLGTLGNRPGNRFNVPNTALESESVAQYDVGLRRLGSALSLELVAYYVDYTDRITSVSTNTETPDGRDIVQSRNAASASIYGVEAGFRVALNSATRLSGGLNYTRGTQTVGAVEEPSDRIPPLSGFLSGGFRFNDRLALDAGVRFASAQHRLSDRDVRDNRIDPAGTPGWISVNAGADVSFDHDMQLLLVVDNIFDKRYRYHGSGIDAPGRNFSVQLRKLWR